MQETIADLRTTIHETQKDLMIRYPTDEDVNDNAEPLIMQQVLWIADKTLAAINALAAYVRETDAKAMKAYEFLFAFAGQNVRLCAVTEEEEQGTSGNKNDNEQHEHERGEEA